MSSAPDAATRITLLERESASEEVQPLYDRLLADRGIVPNKFKAVANTPALALGFAALLKPLLGDGALPAIYKELIATRIASLNDCEYCVSAHRHLALTRGATPEQVDSIDSYESGPFTEREKAGFRYADQLHQGGNTIDDLAWHSVLLHFSEPELVELTAVAAAFEFFPRFNSALRIPVTPIPS